MGWKMAGLKTNCRQIRIAAGVLLLLIAGLFLLLPWWLAVALGPVAGKSGIAWESVEVEGYHGYVLREVTVRAAAAEIEIDRLVIPQPYPWLAGRMGLRVIPEAVADNVAIRLKKSRPRDGAEPLGPELLESIRESLLKADPWLPEIKLRRLEILFSKNRRPALLKDIRLRSRQLSLTCPAQWSLPAIRADLWFADASVRLALTEAGNEKALRLTAILGSGDPGMRLTGSLVSQGNPLAFKAGFEAGSWIPAGVRMSAGEWPVPVHLLPEAPIGPPSLLADIRLEATGSRFKADVRIRSDEFRHMFRDKPVRADIGLNGDPGRIEVNRLDIESGWLRASLSEAVGFSVGDRQFTNNAKLTLEADLSAQHFLEGSGTLTAEAVVQTKPGTRPELRFSASGEELLVEGFQIPALLLKGTFDYPRLTLDEGTIRLSDDSSVTVAGAYALDSTTLQADARFAIQPELLRERTGSIRVDGPVTGFVGIRGEGGSLRHRGSIDPVPLGIPNLRPLTASLTWTGQSRHSVDVSAVLTASCGKQGKADMAVHAQPGSDKMEIVLEHLHFEDAADVPLELAGPVRIQLSPDKGSLPEFVEPFILTAGETRISGELDTRDASLRLEAANFTIGRLEPWLETDLPPVNLRILDLQVSAFEPLLESTFFLQLEGAGKDFGRLSLLIEGKSTKRGIALETVNGTLDGVPFITGKLELPLTLHPMEPGNGRKTRLLETGRLKGFLKGDLTRELVSNFDDIPFLNHAEGTHIDMSIGGSLESPESHFRARLPRLRLPGNHHPVLSKLTFEDIRINAALDHEQLRIETFTASVRGAGLRAEGSLPIEPLLDFIHGGSHEWRPLLEPSEVRFSLGDFKAASFTDLLPAYLRPTGRLSGDLRLGKGTDLTGSLHLEDFGIRPTLYSLTVDRIHATLNLENSRMTLGGAGASIGESSVVLDGFLDFEDLRTPTWSIRVTGERAPLLRTPDILLHADVDLELARPHREAPAHIKGSLDFRESILLMDIDPLASRTAGASLPGPPFFSIATFPFADWELDVAFSGKDAIRLKSQFARALFSVQIQLGGTLGDPVWVGNVHTSSGYVDFPGTRLSLSRSEIFITRERQDVIQLDANAIGRTASYVVSMDVGGTVDNPLVQFASTPALSNARILHLLATGSTTESGISSIGLYLGKSLLAPGPSGDGLLDRLSLEVGREVTESGKDTVDVYFNLTEDLRLHGLYDKYDTHNLDLVWEVFSR